MTIAVQSRVWVTGGPHTGKFAIVLSIIGQFAEVEIRNNIYVIALKYLERIPD